MTDFVRSEYAGDKKVSFLLMADDADDVYVTFGSKEGDLMPRDQPGKRPVLEIVGAAIDSTEGTRSR